MKKFEILTLIVIAVLLSVRIFSGMYFYVFLRVLLVLISIFYMWFGFFLFNEIKLSDLFYSERRQKLSPLKVLLSIAAGLIYSLSFITIIHNMEFYRGMNFLLGFAFTLNLGLLVVVFVLMRAKTLERKFIKQFLSRSLIFCGLFFIVLIVPVEKRLNTLYKQHPRFIEAYKAHMLDPDNEEKHQELREERSAFR